LDFYKQALSTGDRPNDPLENFVFIEGSAHAGKWDDARRLTKDVYKFSKEVMRPLLCTLWQRIERETPASPEKQKTIPGVFADIDCSP
jgi:hypothetical protein